MPASRPVRSFAQRVARSRRWHDAAVVGLVIGGLAGGEPGPPLRAQEIDGGSTPPAMAEPQLLSPGEVADGLRRRFEAMAERDALRRAQRLEEPPREYDLPDVSTDGPLPPDAAGGEGGIEQPGGGE